MPTPTEKVVFEVLGKPEPKGSMKSIGARRGFAQLIPSNQKPLAKWAHAVAYAASRAWTIKHTRNGFRPSTSLLGPFPAKGVAVKLDAKFFFERPAGHWGTGRNRNRLRPSAPREHKVKPDLDKLVRAIGDAITGVIIDDDARICAFGEIEKRWIDNRDECPRAVITVQLYGESDCSQQSGGQQTQ